MDMHGFTLVHAWQLPPLQDLPGVMFESMGMAMASPMYHIGKLFPFVLARLQYAF